MLNMAEWAYSGLQALFQPALEGFSQHLERPFFPSVG